MSVNETLESVLAKFERMLTQKTVIGEPVQVGSITLIPVMDVALGMGGGGGVGKQAGASNEGEGGGGGAGGRLSARAIIAVRDGEVSIYPIAKSGALEKIVELVPTILEKVRGGRANAE